VLGGWPCAGRVRPSALHALHMGWLGWITPWGWSEVLRSDPTAPVDSHHKKKKSAPHKSHGQGGGARAAAGAASAPTDLFNTYNVSAEKRFPLLSKYGGCSLTARSAPSSPFNSTPTCPTCSLSSHLPQQLLSHAAQLLLLPRAGRDLTQYAAAGKLDPVVGRTAEMERLIQILVRRTKNNPCLLGDPGVGKTAIVEGLAQMIACEESTVPELLRQKRVRLS
jgi:hypothetical protein